MRVTAHVPPVPHRAVRRGSLRNSRRALASPAEQADVGNANLATHARPDQFVTGLMIRIRLADGMTELVNAGHPLPYLVRDGRTVMLDLVAELPLGLQTEPYTPQALQLRPDDRLTDGYFERKAARVDIEGILAATLDRHPRQIVRELAHNVLRATGGNLTDDATVLCIDWYGSAGRRERHRRRQSSPRHRVLSGGRPSAHPLASVADRQRPRAGIASGWPEILDR